MIGALDRPVWNSLTGRLAHLAVASGAAVRLNPSFGTFAAARDDGDEAQKALAATLRGPDDQIWIVERRVWPAPPGTREVRRAGLLQMIHEGDDPGLPDDPRVELLGECDAVEMAALAHATEPGPWRKTTHRYGDYYGIRMEGRLAAMAGERMKLPGMAELSGVATWPEFRGRGFANVLTRRVLHGFFQRGEQPFLHCYAGNEGAIALYERLGFRRRAELTVTILALA